MAGQLWHSYAGPKMYRICAFLGILMGLAIVVAVIVIFKPCGSPLTDDPFAEVLDQNKRSVMKPKDAMTEHLTPTGGILMLTEGSTGTISCDPVEINQDSTVSCPRLSEVKDAHVYICKDPCSWSDVKAHTSALECYTAGMGLDDRFTVTKDSKKGKWMTVKIADVKAEDAGVYWCAVDVMGIDWYQNITVLTKPPTKPIQTETERYQAVNRAMELCAGNQACSLAVLQREELGVRSQCWVCLQLFEAWTVYPLLTKDVAQTSCLIPRQMTRVLQAQETLSKGQVPKRIQLNCSTPLLKATITPFRVKSRKGDVCVCRHDSDVTYNFGDSLCDSSIWIPVEKGKKCSTFVKDVKVDFDCPFDMNWEASPGAVWVCGNSAYYFLPPFKWSGCCYPALMSVVTKVYRNSSWETAKRALLTDPSMPDAYNGYTLYNPFANLGSPIFLGGGAHDAVNEISGMAWNILALANSTGDQMIIQDTIVADTIIAESNGVCRIVDTSCCFNLPDYNDKVTDLMSHMSLAPRPLPEADNSQSGDWHEWLIHQTVTVVFWILLFALFLSCFKFGKFLIGKRLNADKHPTSHPPVSPALKSF